MLRFILFFSGIVLCTAQYYYNPEVSAQVAYQQPSYQQYIQQGLNNQATTITYRPGGITRPLNQPIREEYNKEFYTFSAPAQSSDKDEQIDRYIANVLKKNLRVIFIKNPEHNAIEQAALKLAQSKLGDRTAIYVLSRQPDLKKLVDQLHNAKEQHKPEVHFVNYNTPNGAEHIEHSIQGKYEQYPGSTTLHNSIAQQWNYGSTLGNGAVNPNEGATVAFGIGNSNVLNGLSSSSSSSSSSGSSASILTTSSTLASASASIPKDDKLGNGHEIILNGNGPTNTYLPPANH